MNTLQLVYSFINLFWVLFLAWRHIFFWFLLIRFSCFFCFHSAKVYWSDTHTHHFLSLCPILQPCYFLVLKRSIILHLLGAQKSLGDFFFFFFFFILNSLLSNQTSGTLYCTSKLFLPLFTSFHPCSQHPAASSARAWTIIICCPGLSVPSSFLLSST